LGNGWAADIDIFSISQWRITAANKKTTELALSPFLSIQQQMSRDFNHLFIVVLHGTFVWFCTTERSGVDPSL
jgi:hypothetical protein